MKKPEYLQTKIFLDSGDPNETRQAIEVVGFLDGQTTNPSLVAKNPALLQEIQAGKFSEEKLWEEYKKIALEILSILPTGAISVEVYADAETSHEAMLDQAHKLAEWFPGVYVKLPITQAGLKVAEILAEEGVNINMTLCFSQEQAAAVHVATRRATKPNQVFISPFIGRLDDQGSRGMDLVKNILTMYEVWNSHVQVLGASIRNIDHLLDCIRMRTPIITVPLSVLQEWQAYGIEKNPASVRAKPSDLAPIQFQDLLQQDWVLYNLHHELTDKGIEKFAGDWKKLFS